MKNILILFIALFSMSEIVQAQKGRKPLNINHMMRGYFYASSPFVEDLAGFGGWGGSANDFKQMDADAEFEKGKLSVVVRPDEEVTFFKEFQGMKLYVANTAVDTAFIEAQDSRIYLQIQARDEDGKWNDIDYLPSSWCGNSYHSVFLPTNHYWEFTIPVFKGRFETKLRAKLYNIKIGQDHKSGVVYSNEFSGSVNPGQFTEKKDYSPKGLMDPYND